MHKAQNSTFHVTTGESRHFRNALRTQEAKKASRRDDQRLIACALSVRVKVTR